MENNNENESRDFYSKLNLTLKETNISLLKTKINFLPVFGPIINEFLFDLAGRIKQERVNKFVDVLAIKLNKIETTSIKTDYLKSEDFYDLTNKIFEHASKSKDDFKRQFLANIYFDSIKFSKSKNEMTLVFSDFITSMTANHINILHFVKNYETELKEIGNYPSYYSLFNKNFPETIVDKYEFKYYNSDLEAKALISTGGGLNNFDDQSSRRVLEQHKDASIILTTLGQKFIEHLAE